MAPVTIGNFRPHEPARDSAPKRFLSWLQLPFASATVMAAFSQLLLGRFLAASRSSGNWHIDAIVTTLAVLSFAAVAFFQTWRVQRKEKPLRENIRGSKKDD